MTKLDLSWNMNLHMCTSDDARYTRHTAVTHTYLLYTVHLNMTNIHVLCTLYMLYICTYMYVNLYESHYSSVCMYTVTSPMFMIMIIFYFFKLHMYTFQGGILFLSFG